MSHRGRVAFALGGVFGAALLLWVGYAAASHRPGLLHACIADGSGKTRAAVQCRAGETAAVLVTEEGLTAVEARLASLEADRVALQTRVEVLEALLAGVSRTESTLTFSGMNLQLVNGEGTTASANGLGNLIVGYNETKDSGVTLITPSPRGPVSRTGSHYVVVGVGHDWTSYGGLVAGTENSAYAPYATVLGGHRNSAVASASVVSGGGLNRAEGRYSSVSGGVVNVTTVDGASVSGGGNNLASGFAASVSGGRHNVASGAYSTVSGGRDRSVEVLDNWRAGELIQEW